MRTYDGFGTFSEDSPNVWTAKFNLSVPTPATGSYTYTLKNVTTPTGTAKHRNGITISFNLGANDTGVPLMNRELELQNIVLDLNYIETQLYEDAHGVKAGEFDYEKPFYVFMFHDRNNGCYKNNDEACWNLLKDGTYCPVIPSSPGSSIMSSQGPAKTGFGMLKKV